jgi:hypothetical protein
MKARITLKTDKAYLCYKKLKARPSFRDRRILGTFERFLFKESVLSKKRDLPFIVEVTCLNMIIGEQIKFPEPIREAYNKLGCEEGKDYELGEV